MLRLQDPLPDRYTTADDEQLRAWIRAAKADLGSQLLILGHHDSQGCHRRNAIAVAG